MSLRFKLKWKIGLLLLLVLALVGASYQLMSAYVQQQSQRLEQQRQADMEWVLVFQTDLEKGHTVTLDDLQQRKYPPGYISEDWLRPQDAMAIVGTTTQHFVSSGEPVTLSSLQQARRASFSDVLAPGEYAVTATISIDQIHHGLIAIGNRVSLVGVTHRFGESASSNFTAIRNVEVLAIDNATEAAWHQGLASTLTFRFTAQQAQQFEELRNGGYAVWLQQPEHHYVEVANASPVRIHRINNGGQE